MSLKTIETWNSEQVQRWLEREQIRKRTGIECPHCKKELLHEQDFPGIGPPQMSVVCEDPLCAYSTLVIAHCVDRYR